MRPPSAAFAVLTALFAAAVSSAFSVSGPRLLVVLDDVADKNGYSLFLGDLEARGFQITFENPKSDSLALFYLGDRAYDHIFFLPSRMKALGPGLSPATLLNFINAQGNIMIALSSTIAIPTSLVGLLTELDIALPTDRTSLVVDHFHYDAISAADKHDVLLLPTPQPIRRGIRSFFSPGEAAADGSLIAFPRGTAHSLGAGPLLTPVLRAPRTAYSYNPKEDVDISDPENLFAAGEQIALVSVAQARNSARVALVGSAEMLSDAWFDAKVRKVGGRDAQTWNREFARRISGWTFHEIGVLRANSIEHSLSDLALANVTSPTSYRIKNEVTYKISLSEFSWDTWMPFVPPEGDKVQLEFSMLSPFHRIDLTASKPQSSNQTTFSTSFMLPDQHGIFNFIVDYKRPFLTNVEEKRTVSVRHFAHDEWPRSYVIPGAWPWLSGVLATITGFVAFCTLWMYSKPVEAAGKTKKNQ